MFQRFIAFITSCVLIIDAIYLYDDEDSAKNTFNATEFEFEPSTAFLRDSERSLARNIDCEDFSGYAVNCTMEAALMYNSSRKAPPLPAKMEDWCRAIRHLTSCAVDWNSDCREVTESHFNEESIKGHMHVVENVCQNDTFAMAYEGLTICIESASDLWEACYTIFKALVEEEKNKRVEWTHYETHFFLCCARAEFRRCTFNALFSTAKCTQPQAVTLQKFSIIVSEGDVFQDCDSKMVYSSCPGGDPRPSTKQLNDLMSLQSKKSTSPATCNILLVLFCSLSCYL